MPVHLDNNNVYGEPLVMAYPHCCMKGRQEVQWGRKKMFQKHPGLHNFCQIIFKIDKKFSGASKHR